MLTTISTNGTFHGMGMITAVTPKTCSGESIPKAKVTSLDVTIVGKEQICYHKEESHGMSAVAYQKLLDLNVQDSYENLDIL